MTFTLLGLALLVAFLDWIASPKMEDPEYIVKPGSWSSCLPG
jgi:hypothetical protein